MQMKMLTLVGLALTTGVQAQVVEFSGQIQAGELTEIAWVNGSKMWGSNENGTATATSVNGFNFPNQFGGFNVNQFSWEIGGTAVDLEDLDLDVGQSQSPGVGVQGFEYYTNLDGPTTTITFKHGADVWATGTVDFVRTLVPHVNAVSATGTGQATITAHGGGDTTFFDDIMLLSGGTGQLDFTFTSFEAVDAAGLFNSAGSFTVVPEPSEYALMFVLLGGGAIALRRARLRREGEVALANA